MRRLEPRRDRHMHKKCHGLICLKEKKKSAWSQLLFSDLWLRMSLTFGPSRDGMQCNVTLHVSMWLRELGEL